MTGIAPAASSSRTTRSTPELHPDGLVYVAGLAPTFSRIRTERPRCWATRRRISTPPVNRTLLPAFGLQGRPRRRRKKYHREESNLNQRPSQNRVPPWNGGVLETIYSLALFIRPIRSLRFVRLAASLRHVWMAGIAPATSWLSPTRSAAELHPGWELGATERIRTSTNEIRSLVSLPRVGGGGLNGRNRTCGLVVPDHAL